MPSRNPITGDLLQSKAYSKQGAENHERIFGKKKPERGTFRWCKETKKFIAISEWYDKYGSPERKKSPMIFVNHFEAFESPIDGTVITNKRKHDYDLKKNGCRVYEGFESEKREADKYRQREEQQLKSKMMETAERTYHEIEHGYRKLGD